MPNARRKIPALASTSNNAANGSVSKAWRTTPSALECLQIGDDVDDLIALEIELRMVGWFAMIPSAKGPCRLSIGYFRCKVRNGGAIVRGLSLALSMA